MGERNTAAFYRVEGTLLTRPTIAAAAWLTLHAQDLSHRVSRLTNVAMALPFSLIESFRDPMMAVRVAWSAVRGMSEDRLHILGEEYFQAHLAQHVSRLGKDLLEQARRQGHRIVLISDNVDVVIRPLGQLLGVDDVVCNSLEVRGGFATGRFNDPVIAGHIAGQWARGFATNHDIDLGSSLGYGHSSDDSLLLSAIGRPCAVNPDRKLRKIARDLDWPVVDG